MAKTELVSPTSIDDAKTKDIETVAHIWAEGWNEAHSGILPTEITELRTIDYFRDQLKDNLASIRIAELGGTVVGFAIVRKDELDELYVLPVARGTGIAAALVADALDRIRRAGYRRAWLACGIGNDRAARFYEKSGWSREGSMTIHMKTSHGSEPVHVWRYEIAV